MEDFGYCLETVILKATELGLGTVWLAGSLNRTTFSKKINLKENELLPAVTPVGYQAEHTTLKEKFIRGLVRSTSRKNFGELFFAAQADHPLEKQTLGAYGDILEGVREAPSASNKQPWRIIKETGTNTFHFYLCEDKPYNNKFKDIQIQRLDMGIAMCHFELAARDLGVPGKWLTARPGPDAGELVYIATWQG
jgi:nitroreductase